jgi:DNA-binding NtrC family response regulator
MELDARSFPGNTPRPEHIAAGFIGAAVAMWALSQRLPRAASAERTTLIYGETGTGKELVARTLHGLSSRRNRPFVTVHCGAIPDSLVEAELFGHARGAFTGATQAREGLVQLAGDGVLFLDEVNSLSFGAQTRILRLLESGEYRQVGTDVTRHSHAWVIAATNEDLQRCVASEQFRMDLFHRLDVVRLNVPPLRQRTEDILLLAEHFKERFGRPGLHFTAPARAALLACPWQGNVRELKNRVESAVIMAEADAIDAADLGLPEPLHAPMPVEQKPTRDLWSLIEEEGMSLDEAVRWCERELISRELSLEGQNRTRAAQRLGIHVRTIFKKLAGPSSGQALEAAFSAPPARGLSRL